MVNFDKKRMGRIFKETITEKKMRWVNDMDFLLVALSMKHL